jgi:hypothetical protein
LQVSRKRINSPKISPVACSAASSCQSHVQRFHAKIHKEILQESHHFVSHKRQTCPYSLAPKQYGIEAQAPLPPDSSPELDKAVIKQVQQIIVSILCYDCAVGHDSPCGPQHNSCRTNNCNINTMERCTQMVDYLVHNSDVKVRFRTSEMVINIQSYVSYLSAAKARSQRCGYFFHGMVP